MPCHDFAVFLFCYNLCQVSFLRYLIKDLYTCFFQDDSNRSLLSEKKFSKECIRCCVLQNKAMSAIEVRKDILPKERLCQLLSYDDCLTPVLYIFPKTLGWPTSTLLLDTNLIPFQVSAPPHSFSIDNLIPSQLSTVSMEPVKIFFYWKRKGFWATLQELLGFFLVANDETRRNVNSLIKVNNSKIKFDLIFIHFNSI